MLVLGYWEALVSRRRLFIVHRNVSVCGIFVNILTVLDCSNTMLISVSKKAYHKSSGQGSALINHVPVPSALVECHFLVCYSTCIF